MFIAVGGRRGGVAIGSVAHRPNPRYVDEDDADEVVACLKDTIYPTTSSQIVALGIGRRRRRLCAIDGSGLIRVWRFELSPTLQIKKLEREAQMYQLEKDNLSPFFVQFLQKERSLFLMKQQPILI